MFGNLNTKTKLEEPTVEHSKECFDVMQLVSAPNFDRAALDLSTVKNPLYCSKDLNNPYVVNQHTMIAATSEAKSINRLDTLKKFSVGVLIAATSTWVLSILGAVGAELAKGHVSQEISNTFLMPTVNILKQLSRYYAYVFFAAFVVCTLGITDFKAKKRSGSLE